MNLQSNVDFWSVASLDFGEVRRSRWLALGAGVSAGLGGLFIFVGMRESLMLGFTGGGRVLLSLCHGLVFLLPLLALAATVQAIGGAREDGTLELILSMPVRRSAYLAAVSVCRYAAA